MTGHVTIPGRRGGRRAESSLDRSRDITYIHRWKHARARSNRACHVRELNNTGMRTFLAHIHGRAGLDQGAQFFAYISLVIEFKGIVMKLKNVSHTISME